MRYYTQHIKLKNQLDLLSSSPSGYGSQALALKYLGVNFEHWKICEWAIKSIQAYKDIHFGNDDTDYSKNLTLEQIKEYLFKKGISSNYNDPMSEKQVSRLSEHQARTIYNNIKATHNLVNIQQVKGADLKIKDTDKFTYILTYSFPCQDLSLAGTRKLMSDTSTRSGMLWEVERILTELEEKPEILLMENVPQVHGEGAKEDFNKWQLRLEELGYKNYWQDLIATDYGIPQTRNRCFMVSILGDYNYTFPKPVPLKLKLKDMLEDNVLDKYYLSERCIETMLKYDVDYIPNGLSPTLTTELSHHTGKNLTPKVIKEIYNAELEKYYLSDKMINYITSKDDKYKVNENNLVINRDIACSKTTREGWTRADTSDYICNELPSNTNILKIKNKSLKETLERNEIEDTCYIDTYNKRIDKDKSGTITTGVSFRNNTFLAIKNANSKGYLEATDGDGIDISGRMQYHRGTVQKDKTQTLSTMGGENNGVVVNDLRIRKLTPYECFALMGVKREDYDKVAKNQSDSSLYHLAGDSLITTIMMALFSQMLDINWENKFNNQEWWNNE